MATVNQLQLEQAALEHDLKQMVGDDHVAQQAVRAGFSVAIVAATQCVLELTIKGVIAEGRGGKIQTAIAEAVAASRDRVTQ